MTTERTPSFCLAAVAGSQALYLRMDAQLRITTHVPGAAFRLWLLLLVTCLRSCAERGESMGGRRAIVDLASIYDALPSKEADDLLGELLEAGFVEVDREGNTVTALGDELFAYGTVPASRTGTEGVSYAG